MNLKSVSICFAAVVAVGALGAAHATTIDFEAGPFGAQPNGFSATGFPGVTFTDTIGADLEVDDFGDQGDGQSLAVNSDDPSALLINFATPAINLSMDFGNDDPNFASRGDVALLTLFLGGTQVGQTSVVMNLDDIMNQSISLSGIQFDSATFVYADANFDPINLIEVVDNISFTNAVGVPEPPSFGLVALALALLALVGMDVTRRRRRV